VRAILSFAFVSLSIACGGAAQERLQVQAPKAMPTTAPPVAALPVEAPSSLALWVHVAQPARLAAIASALSDSAKAAAHQRSCAEGDVAECVLLIDATRPVDFAIALKDGADLEATAFSVDDVGSFRERAKKTFASASEPKPGILKVTPTIVCDLADAGSRRVVCGTEGGIALLGPWLRSAPRMETSGIARGKIFAAPVLAAVDKSFPGDGGRDEAVRQLAHDLAGGSMELREGDDAKSLTFDLDLDVHDPQSPWMRALLAPLPATTGSAPDAFGRIEHDATATIYAPGGALSALFEQIAPLASDASRDPAKAAVAMKELGEVLRQPIVCAHSIDLDDARAALDVARKASTKDRDKALASLDDAFESRFVCGVHAPIATIGKLAREIVAVMPPSPGETNAIRSGASLGLSKDAVAIETTTKPALTPGVAKPPPPRKSVVLVVPDGDSTWVVGAEDPRRAARWVKRLLAEPKHPLRDAQATPSIFSGSLSALLGAFAWNLALHDLDKLDASLATPPGQFRFALATRAHGASDTLSLHLASDVATLKAIASGSALFIPMLLVAALVLPSGHATK
jgi:hypothetical protein